MAARRSWADLTPHLIAEIVGRVPCLADRVRAARGCHAWCEGVLLDPRPPQLPWLLRPYTRSAALPPKATRRASFFCVLCDLTHCVTVPRCTGRARFFGAYPGGWLFLAYGQSCGHGLINLRTHEYLDLPDDIAWGWYGVEPRHRMFIRAATLSAPPVPSEGCIGAAIVSILDAEYFFGLSYITFWRMGSPLASCTRQMDAAEDVIYHNGAFHFLVNRGDLSICTPEFQNEAPVEQLEVPEVFWRAYGHGLGYSRAGARYLVECRGELLMVVRMQPHHMVTSEFRVFRMKRLEKVPDAGYYLNDNLHCWTELPTLDGRMLFVGRGCSISFEAAHFPGSQEGVYFLDDGSFHAAPMICYGYGRRQYGCCNNGVCSGPPDHAVRHWFPLQEPSTYSSPVWFLH